MDFYLVRNSTRPYTFCCLPNPPFFPLQDDIVQALDVPSASHCQSLCQSYPGCAVFTYGESYTDANCWLKYAGAVETRRGKKGLVSGRRICDSAPSKACQCGLANRPEQVIFRSTKGRVFFCRRRKTLFTFKKS